ncbi:hypothetical protein COT42_05430 [Candidatus Saganbacteria bacterium CG08_land_8_20_14_0_20_45_16]|uniref:Outer membrane protein beta-barrel domain-containing protein n=1 Tax=Candidatus Saganbacteria bacterium CG08_land_8_20_14_0_20_45_16 TaxID=2014293 RepID=A0A2H0XWT4_UNCSA|nr:MAG: hypothetical protein COT42_05430 [Candidatus Saganbacteria bacterium CG08_land_8_20_14_0_20_45_16]
MRFKIGLLLFICLASTSQAYLLNTSGILAPQKMVVQSDYFSRSFSSQADLNQSGVEFKIGYGFADCWNALAYVVPGSYPAVAGQVFQTIGLDIEYGVIKNKLGSRAPLDLSFLVGLEVTKVTSHGALAIDQTAGKVGLILGKNVKFYSATATPYIGTKATLVSQSHGSQITDLEADLGLKYNLAANLSWQVELAAHWLRGASLTNGLEWAAGLAWAL